jgi:hypothetical protein
MDVVAIPPRRTATAVMPASGFAASQQPPQVVFVSPAPQQQQEYALFSPPPAARHAYPTLRKLNIAAACLHAALAGGFALYFAAKLSDADSQQELLPLSLFTHTRPGFAKKRGRVAERALAAAIVSFFAITAAAHAVYALDFGGFYTTAVSRGNSWFRWIEYGVTATTMTVVIAATGGVRDLYALVSLAALSVAIMATGQWFEREARRHDALAYAVAPLAVGFAMLGVVWYVVVAAFRDRVEEIEATPGAREIPSWIIAAIITTLLFFSAFGAVPIAQLIASGGKTGRGVIAWYPKAEGTYLVLSAAAKATLASFLAYGLGERVAAAEAGET